MWKKTDFDVQSCVIQRLLHTFGSLIVVGRVNIIVCRALHVPVGVAMGFSNDPDLLDIQICFFEGLQFTHVSYLILNFGSGMYKLASRLTQ